MSICFNQNNNSVPFLDLKSFYCERTRGRRIQHVCRNFSVTEKPGNELTLENREMKSLKFLWLLSESGSGVKVMKRTHLCLSETLEEKIHQFESSEKNTEASALLLSV